MGLGKKTVFAMILATLFMMLFATSARCEELSDSVYQETTAESQAGAGSPSEGAEEPEYPRGRVVRVLDQTQEETEFSGGNFSTSLQLLEVLVLNGSHAGETVQAEYMLNYGFSDKYEYTRLSEGDEVFLYLQENDEGNIDFAYVTEIVRDKYILYLVIGFLLALLAVGRLKGLKAIVSLVLTALAIVKILIPAILKGWDPVRVSVLICIGVISVTLLIISGYNKKTLSAIIGTAGGVIVAGVIALLIGSMAKLTGFGDDESQMLMYIPQNVTFDFRGLLFAGILIGTMGATMDVGMSIASAMHEIKENSPNIKTSALFRAGMNVGRDAMATMSNTLILAYAGGSLHMMLLLMAYQTPFTHIINWDMIASEILRSLAGSIGIIFAIPITALASVMIEKYEKRDSRIYSGSYRY
ncbi:YibE/F family protein [Thermoclostridium caenicola]|uniref:Uncharacterized membrane protein n=1 Tax=Thermoclostridium caenicola TaxID=659425 RepID=A0A1M6APY5_9FIRM|nr:YibE/F family protein [Thermoclostridium caenicola]SHI38467.1 Uncharacterized membrane protein [Thermoclostridium caenicola]